MSDESFVEKVRIEFAARARPTCLDCRRALLLCDKPSVVHRRVRAVVNPDGSLTSGAPRGWRWRHGDSVVTLETALLVCPGCGAAKHFVLPFLLNEIALADAAAHGFVSVEFPPAAPTTDPNR